MTENSEVTIPENVLATLKYVRQFAKTTVLIKLGGAVLQDLKLVDSLCEDLSLIRSVGHEKRHHLGLH